MPTGVTPAGIRAGEPHSLAGLVELRGRAVRAYAGTVAGPDDALAAAAEALANFRAHVIQATDVRAVDPDALLLRASRESSAARAPRPVESGATLRRLARRGDSPCELAPRLLAARANRELTHEDAVRLDRHLASCPACRDLRKRFRSAENLYAEGAGAPLVERDARALLVALARAGPLAEGTPQSIADEALALLSADAVRRPVATRPAAPPAEAPAVEAPPPAEAPAVEA
ncbi:MAG TPA: zf-HC2 domain-containing protein, partial [Solirubrobacteraceae bacterium]|nr:zf-HC2 domain-containing protein [Solirubrobacteraceae bacterium]